MGDTELEISTRAYCKMLMHAAKYPSSSINGVLLSKVTVGVMWDCWELSVFTYIFVYDSYQLSSGWRRAEPREVCRLHPHAPHQHRPRPHGRGRTRSGQIMLLLSVLKRCSDVVLLGSDRGRGVGLRADDLRPVPRPRQPPGQPRGHLQVSCDWWRPGHNKYSSLIGPARRSRTGSRRTWLQLAGAGR